MVPGGGTLKFLQIVSFRETFLIESLVFGILVP